MKALTASLALLALCAPPGLAASSVSAVPDAGGLALYRELPEDPLLVVAFSLRDPAGELDRLIGMLERLGLDDPAATLQRSVSRLEDGAGISVRERLLAHVGPEVAVFVDAPPIDAAVAAMQGSNAQAAEALLAQVGLVAQVDDPDEVLSALGRLLTAAGFETSRSADELEVCLPLADDDPNSTAPHLTAHVAASDGRLAAGISREWVRSALRGSAPGERLVDGEDFARVFAQLDRRPDGLTYVNLPKIRRYVAGSQLLQLALQAQPEAQRFVQQFFTEETMGVGIGSTTVDSELGVRSTRFGPRWTSGSAVSSGLIAALALPNLMAAVDRVRTRTTLDDLEAIARACESFSGDSRGYPGPTEGWVPVESIAIYLEPVYIASLPRSDAWEHPILYWSDGTSYRLLSTGRDGLVDRDWSAVESPTASPSMDGDIVIADGRLLVVPEQLVAE